MSKFLPQGTLSLELQPDSAGKARTLTIPQGLTIRFTVTRKFSPGTQTANFRIYGLGEQDREAIYKDVYDWTIFRGIQFRAGYQNFTPLIFNGTILQAYSEKEGITDTVTVIDAFDGGFPMTNGYIATSVPPGTRADQIIAAFGAKLPGVISAPIVGSFPSVNLRTEVIVGNTWGVILDKAGGNATIDNGQVKAVNPNEAVAGAEVPLISADTGLIGVPRRSGAMVELDMVFEPRLNLLQTVDLQSRFNRQFNGIHKIIQFEHRGAISTSHSVPNVTTGRFIWFPKSVVNPDLKGILLSNP